MAVALPPPSTIERPCSPSRQSGELCAILHPMIARHHILSIVALTMLVELPAAASDRCTISYRLDASLQVTDTYLRKGDVLVNKLPGSLVIEFQRENDGPITDGKVKVLHFAVLEQFKIDTLVDVTTTLHHFAPTCNGTHKPTWRSPADEGFPVECRYTGNEKAVAVGRLSRDDEAITWAKCKAAESYWAKSRDAYVVSDESKGRGCLDEMHAVGNVRCDGKLACKLGGLKPGDNPQFDVWTQPLIHGPPGSKNSVEISSDLRTIRTPTGRKDGFLSYNLPTEAPSRVWISWVATRDDASPHTTCP